MGVSSSFVFRERNSSQSMKFVDDDEMTAVNDWEMIEDDLEDDEEPTKNFDEMLTTRLPSSEKYVRPSLSQGLSYLGDLKSKSDYVLQDEKITTAFVRYLFQGMWIPELLQIPVVSSPVSSPTHSATQPIFPEYKFDGVFLSSCVDDDSWKPLLTSLDALCGNPSSAAVLASENPLITIVDKVCVKRGDSAFLLTLAVAMQAFCRSEVFLQLSEQQWSPEAFRSIVWTDYARVGRAVVVQHYQHQLLQTEAEGGDVTRGHIALLDALYVHLMTTSSQRDTLDYLRPASDESASHWLSDLQAVMLSLPVSWAVYETNASNAASLPKEESMPTVFACQQQSGLLKSLLSWQCLFHTGSKLAPATQGCSSPPTTAPLIVPIHCYAASTAQSILRRLHTTTAATQLAFPVLTADASPEAHLCFECIQPILRCPLLAFDRDGNLSEVATGYRWDVHRAVAAQVNVNFTSALPLVLAQDVAYLLSHIIG